MTTQDLPPILHVLGCSWSRNSVYQNYPFVENKTLSWPELLQLDVGNNYRVRNWGMKGGSNSLILTLCERLLSDFCQEQKFMIIQFTRPSRQTFIKDFDTINQSTHPDNLHSSLHSDVAYYDYKEFPYPDRYDYNFNSQGFCPAHPGMINRSSGKLKQTYENSLMHLIEYSNRSSTIHTEAIQRHCKLLCERRGVPHIMYSHLGQSNIDNSHLDFVLHDEWPELTDYCVDDGHHLSTQGNRILLDRYIKPCMLTKI